MARLRFDNISSFDNANPITVPSGGGTATWVSAPDFPTIEAPDYTVLILQGDSANEQIRYLTAYTAGDLTGTVSAAQEGSTGASATTVTWKHGPTALDFLIGQIPQSPAILAPVDWIIKVAIAGGYAYDNGTDGVGATITANSNGALSIDGGAPDLGDRVGVSSMAFGGAPGPQSDISLGVYVVTDQGDGGSPFVLTRSTDCDTADVLGSYWVALSGPNGDAYYVMFSTPYTSSPPTFDVGSDNLDIGFFPLGLFGAPAPGIAIGPGSSAIEGGFAAGVEALALAFTTAIGYRSTIVGSGAVAVGVQAAASGVDAVAVGSSTTASGDGSAALGVQSEAQGTNSVALGRNSLAVRNNSITLSNDALSYDDGQTVIATGADGSAEQYSVTMGEIFTTDATPQPMRNTAGENRLIRFVDEDGNPDFTKTVIVRIRVVARRTDVVGTDSAWLCQGVARGNSSNAYTWIGGTAPAFTLIAQDVAAVTWAVTVDIGTDPEASVADDAIIVTITGEAATDIQWAATLEMDEVSA